jgi:hypothetical protein
MPVRREEDGGFHRSHEYATQRRIQRWDWWGSKPPTAGNFGLWMSKVLKNWEMKLVHLLQISIVLEMKRCFCHSFTCQLSSHPRIPRSDWKGTCHSTACHSRRPAGRGVSSLSPLSGDLRTRVSDPQFLLTLLPDSIAIGWVRNRNQSLPLQNTKSPPSDALCSSARVIPAGSLRCSAVDLSRITQVGSS